MRTSTSVSRARFVGTGTIGLTKNMVYEVEPIISSQAPIVLSIGIPNGKLTVPYRSIHALLRDWDFNLR